MKELLEYIASTLVDNPSEIVIKERTSRHNVTFDLIVAQADTGKVIGRNGRVARCIRDMMSVAAARRNKRVHVDIKS